VRQGSSIRADNDLDIVVTKATMKLMVALRSKDFHLPGSDQYLFIDKKIARKHFPHFEADGAMRLYWSKDNSNFVDVFVEDDDFVDQKATSCELHGEQFTCPVDATNVLKKWYTSEFMRPLTKFGNPRDPTLAKSVYSRRMADDYNVVFEWQKRVRAGDVGDAASNFKKQNVESMLDWSAVDTDSVQFDPFKDVDFKYSTGPKGLIKEKNKKKIRNRLVAAQTRADDRPQDIACLAR
jgi:hypothetical protein